MVSIAAWARPRVSDAGATVVVASADGDVRARMVAALGGSGLMVRGVAAMGETLPGAELPDLLVLHRERLGAAELTVLRDLGREHDELRIVVVCEAPTGRNARRAIDGGVNGFVLTEQ